MQTKFLLNKTENKCDSGKNGSNAALFLHQHQSGNPLVIFLAPYRQVNPKLLVRLLFGIHLNL